VDGATDACAGTNDATAGNERDASHGLTVTMPAGPPSSDHPRVVFYMWRYAHLCSSQGPGLTGVTSLTYAVISAFRTLPDNARRGCGGQCT